MLQKKDANLSKNTYPQATNQKNTHTTALLYTTPPFNRLNLSGLWPIVRSSTACQGNRLKIKIKALVVCIKYIGV